MEPVEIFKGLRSVAKNRSEWVTAKRMFEKEAERVTKRLILEAAQNNMSVDQVATALNMPRRRIREKMRSYGVDPKLSRALLADSAAKALHENAALLGIDPSEMDLMSPLAYLPMGSELRRKLAEAPSMHGVKELPGDPA